MTDLHKGYKLHIELLDTKYPNTRDIEVLFVNTVDELHQMIQKLYGLDDCHLRYIADHPTQSTREVRPEEYGRWEEIERMITAEFNKFDFTQPETVLDAKNTLLAQFISKVHKIIWYTYDLGNEMQWKITYKWLTQIPMRHNVCTAHTWTYLLEDCPVRELDEYREIYEAKDKKKLKQERDWFASWKEFEEFISPVYEPMSCEILEEKMNQIVQKKILR